MNYNEEVGNEFKSLGLGGKVIPLDEKDRGTNEEWATLEREVAYCMRENEKMMVRSKLLADRSAIS